MTKGQKIIGSLLIVVAVGLVLNLSRDVTAQDLDHYDHVRAIELAAQAIVDAQARASWAADSRARRAEDAADLRQRTAAMEADALRSRQAPWPSQPTTDWVSPEEMEVFYEYLTMTRSDVAQLKYDVVWLKDYVSNLSFQQHLLQLKHVSIDTTERDRMGKMFDEMLAAEKQTEAQPDD